MKTANAVILYDNFIRNIALNSQIRGKNRDKIRIIKLKKMLGIQMHHQNGFYPIAKKGPSTIHYVSKIDNPSGTIPILRQQRDWVSGVRKMAIFADVQYYSC